MTGAVSSFKNLLLFADLALSHLVFSAPHYCDSTGNKGAFINIGSEYKLAYTQFEAVPHPPVKPMAYAANGLMGLI